MAKQGKKAQPAPQTPDDAAQLAAQGQEPAPEVPATYFDYQYADGKKDEFKTREDLEKAWRDNYLRRSDYSKRVREIAEQRKALEDDRKKFDSERNEFGTLRTRYDEYDRYLRQNPQVATELRNRMNGVQQSQIPSEWEERFKTMEQKLEEATNRLQEQEQSANLNEVYSSMAKKYEDWDEGSITELLQYVQDNGDNPEALIETLYFANKGRRPVEEVEQNVAQKLTAQAEEKKAAGITPSTGNGGPPKPSNDSYANEQEAADAAMRDWAGVQI